MKQILEYNDRVIYIYVRRQFWIILISYPGELVISLWIFQLEYILRKYGYWINVLSLMAVGNYIMTVDYKDSPGSTNNSDASNKDD